ncbi:BREX-1 system adenine-specific DNA-methyltransferase PglX [Schleiferiaceae bacterium]|nr:BREX-1 system adenine-specific DNA-methyltransferase PglX [Schleiferiaceae bacterium]
MVYDQLTGGAKTAEQFTRYTWYIGHVFDELAIDLPAVFDRFSPYALLFPSEKVLLELLEIINDEDLNIYRESGHQPINLWTEDETIGWIYQYYNSREEISEMREASGAPRNSRELAVRNQFFTPRYVVQFLVDNSLGRQWFEMTKGQTALIDSCQYMVKREQEIFLAKGEEIPGAKIEGANYIEYRALKDPREILMLDPACGSMHFGLYCFDLFEQIYLEAWDNHPELMTDLRDKYMRDDFIKRIPGYILRYNIHGVDIDPRAIQIAGLSLWLRAQKSYDKLGLQPADRPAISKSNLVIAEPMPGDAHLLSEFTKSLPGPIGKLVRVIWDKMQLAGETGLLLKIEEELKKEIEIAKEEYKEYKNTSAQSALFASPAESKEAEMAAIYGKGQKITKDFFDTAEEEVLKALKGFAENAEGEDAFQKLLFAEDTARGFAFIELCRKRYDVIVMNPPFGAPSISSLEYLRKAYKNLCENLYIGFQLRCIKLLNANSFVSSITDNGFVNKQSFKGFREKIIEDRSLISLINLGEGILDGANVSTSAQILSNKPSLVSLFQDLSSKDEDSSYLSFATIENWKKIDSVNFKKFPNSAFVYDMPAELLESFHRGQNISSNYWSSERGLAASNAYRMFRLHWELSSEKIGLHKKWTFIQNGGAFSPYYFPTYLTVISENQSFKTVLSYNSGRVTGRELYFQKGMSYGKRTDYIYAYLIKEGCVFSVEGHGVFCNNGFDDFEALSIINSSPYQEVINHLCGQHKTSGYVNPARLEISKFPSVTNEFFDVINDLVLLDTANEISTEFIAPLSLTQESFRNKGLFSVKEAVNKKRMISQNANEYRRKYNQASEKSFHWDNNELGFREVDYVKNLFGIDNSIQSEVESILSYAVGIIFGRWNKELININDDFSIKKWFEEDIYTSPNLSGHCFEKQNIVQAISSCSEKLEGDLIFEIKKILEVLSVPGDEIEQLLKQKSVEDFVLSTSGFFNSHYQVYSRSRREAPIYWPIATKSNKYIVWLYYPALNENTLFSVVNELVDPKIKEIAKEVEVLEIKGSPKELNDQKEFLAELEDFKEELLRVAQLPYKPNQDDGVLITAASLHNLFRHTKWKKATQDCWKKLENGEYDWSHLAYSIWPDRVRKKCVKDLSMAIAHGLEEICEVKPKDTKKKKPKEIKEDSQTKLI